MSKEDLFLEDLNFENFLFLYRLFFNSRRRSLVKKNKNSFIKLD